MAVEAILAYACPRAAMLFAAGWRSSWNDLHPNLMHGTGSRLPSGGGYTIGRQRSCRF